MHQPHITPLLLPISHVSSSFVPEILSDPLKSRYLSPQYSALQAGLHQSPATWLPSSHASSSAVPKILSAPFPSIVPSPHTGERHVAVHPLIKRGRHSLDHERQAPGLLEQFEPLSQKLPSSHTSSSCVFVRLSFPSASVYPSPHEVILHCALQLSTIRG